MTADAYTDRITSVLGSLRITHGFMAKAQSLTVDWDHTSAEGDNGCLQVIKNECRLVCGFRQYTWPLCKPTKALLLQCIFDGSQTRQPHSMAPRGLKYLTELSNASNLMNLPATQNTHHQQPSSRHLQLCNRPIQINREIEGFAYQYTFLWTEKTFNSLQRKRLQNCLPWLALISPRSCTGTV